MQGPDEDVKRFSSLPQYVYFVRQELSELVAVDKDVIKLRWIWADKRFERLQPLEVVQIFFWNLINKMSFRRVGGAEYRRWLTRKVFEKTPLKNYENQ